MKIGILGANGRMGQMLVREILSGAHDGAILGAAVEHAKSEALALEIGGGVRVTSDINVAFETCDALIDFTAAGAVPEHAALASQYKKPIVIGTTGLDAEGEAALHAAAKTVPVFYSGNMSIGVNILSVLVEQVAARLAAEDFDIEIFESHHRHKVDAPSGTALLLGHAAAAGRGVALADAMVPARFGQIGARVTGSIGISVFRGGDVIGDHTVTFAGMGERIELTHKASDRAIFARGAIRAALWLPAQNPGLYSMKDVLAL
jgi:4-hydroxy-tetrahydrodipicolinate reductase